MRRSGACRILVVDDHDVVHWGFRELLGEQTWVERCLAARTATEAMEMTKRYHPHVALVDLFLAGESGADVCEAIRAQSPGTRVLLISGAGRMSPRRRGRRARRGSSPRTRARTRSRGRCGWSAWE